MTDRTKQEEEMFKMWSETQKTIIENWAERMKGLGGSQGAELWEKTLATWEDTIVKTMNAQTEWTRQWIENLKSTPGMPEGAVASTARFQEMSQYWIIMQTQLWSNWFKMLRSFDPSLLSGKWAEAFQNPFQVWQQATQKAMEAQAEWLRAWTKSSEKSGDK
jgi:hypothetical protein